MVTGGLDLHLLPFVTENALRINAARLEHFESLGLPLAGKSIADFGGGPGLLAGRLLELGLRTTLFEPRSELAAIARRRNSLLRIVQNDVLFDDLVVHGRFDYGFAYGLLYHLSDPLLGLRNIARVVDQVLFLETQVVDSAEPLVLFTDEPEVANQAVDGWGTRPSIPWLVSALGHAGFPYVYRPQTAPRFTDFVWEPLGNNDSWRENHPLRTVLIASRDRLEGPLEMVAETRRGSGRPALHIGAAGSRLDFAPASSGADQASTHRKILSAVMEIEHVLDGGGRVQDHVLDKWALERTDTLVTTIPGVDLQTVLPAFPHARVVHMSVPDWGDSADRELRNSVDTCRTDGWRVADARATRESTSVQLTRAPLPSVLRWVELEYEIETCQGARVGRDRGSLSVETPVPPWSYGAVLRMTDQALAQVHLTLECAGAPCEVATLASLSGVFHGVTVLPSGNVTSVALRTPNPLHGVVIRTGALTGPARVKLHSISGVRSAE